MTVSQMAPAPYPPGDFLGLVAQGRGWSENDLAIMLGLDRQDVADLLASTLMPEARVISALAGVTCTPESMWVALWQAWEYSGHGSTT